MYRIAIAAALVAAATLNGQEPTKAVAPTLKLPPQVMVDSGGFFRIVAETNCRRLRWRCEGVTRVPAEWLADPNKQFAGVASPGTYRVTCEGTLYDEWVEAACLLIVGQQPPTPVPPIPPGPIPPPPVPPATDLAVELQSLYSADTSPQKAAQKDKLVSLWNGVSGAALRDPELTTVGACTNKMHDASSKWPYMLTAADLAPIRLRLAKEITARVGPAATPLDDAKRKAASALFAEFVTALQTVK